jgi:hypothetical protein
MSVIELKKENGLPTVKYKVGNIQPATYKTKLVLDDGTRIDLGDGSIVNSVGSPTITDVIKLNGASLIWDIRVIRATTDPEEQYSIEVHVFQNGQEICDSISTSGKFGENNAISWKDSIIFDVV